MTVDAPPSRRRRWLVAVAVLWAIVLAVVAYASVRRGDATVRDQSSVADARPVVDRAVGELAAAAGSAVVLHISGYDLERGCRITPVRSGATLTREVTIYTREADGPGLLDQIVRALPAGYDARARHTEKRHALRADAGDFVAIRGSVTSPGVVSLSVETGCRPAGDIELTEPAADRSVINPVLGAFDATTNAVTAAEAPCPNGGTVRTVRADGTPGTPPASLGAPLRALATGGTVIVDTEDRFAYRTPQAAVSVDAEGGEISVAATTPC
ncbi:hypothetical protein K1W54_23990 [Micromonospora sp. CPCC 205371]|nr:hypothetical protein [Micromonospora sp. CPCC 205371]